MTLTVAGLWRYPVKSLAGERLVQAGIDGTGIHGDRMVWVRGSEGVRTARRHYRLLGLQGTLGPEGSALIDGFRWDSSDALALVKAAAGDDAWLEAVEGAERFDILPLLVATPRTADAPPAPQGPDRSARPWPRARAPRRAP